MPSPPLLSVRPVPLRATAAFSSCEVSGVRRGTLGHSILSHHPSSRNHHSFLIRVTGSSVVYHSRHHGNGCQDTLLVHRRARAVSHQTSVRGFGPWELLHTRCEHFVSIEDLFIHFCFRISWILWQSWAFFPTLPYKSYSDFSPWWVYYSYWFVLKITLNLMGGVSWHLLKCQKSCNNNYLQ